MIQYECAIEYYESYGDKTGWSYVFIPQDVAEKLKPGYRKSFRIKGTIDGIPVKGMALLPAKEGNFILALRSALRKALKKEAGDKVQLRFTEDADFKIDLPEDLEMCLLDGEGLLDQFLSMAKSHQNYFINHINQAKTIDTRTRRIAQTVMAMEQKLDFGGMIRQGRK